MNSNRYQKLALFGLIMLLASMMIWLWFINSFWFNPSMFLFPAYVAAASAIMALIGSPHAGWHLFIVRLVAACTLIGCAILALCLVTVAVFSGWYGIALGATIALPSFAWWRFFYRTFDWSGEGDAASAQILATGGVTTLTIAVVLLVLVLMQQSSPNHLLLSTGFATAGSLLAAVGGYGWRRELRATASHLHLPHAAVRLPRG